MSICSRSRPEAQQETVLLWRNTFQPKDNIKIITLLRIRNYSFYPQDDTPGICYFYAVFVNVTCSFKFYPDDLWLQMWSPLPLFSFITWCHILSQLHLIISCLHANSYKYDTCVGPENQCLWLSKNVMPECVGGGKAEREWERINSLAKKIQNIILHAQTFKTISGWQHFIKLCWKSASTEFPHSLRFHRGLSVWESFRE